jgi:hypothetical protein
MRRERFVAVAILAFFEDSLCNFAEFARMLTIEGFDHSSFDSFVLAVGDEHADPSCLLNPNGRSRHQADQEDGKRLE